MPDAHFKNSKEKDKLSLYEQAGKDSDKKKSAMRNDPYFRSDSVHTDENETNQLESIFQKSASKFNQGDFDSKPLSPLLSNNTTDADEKK